MKRFPISPELQEFLRERHECTTITDMREYLYEELQESLDHGYVGEMFFIELGLDDGKLMTEICNIAQGLLQYRAEQRKQEQESSLY